MTKQAIIAQFKSGPEQLDAALRNLSESELDLCRDEGKWSIRQIVHHIADAEDLWKICIKAAAGNPGCTFDFSWYILDNKWANPLGYHTRPITEAVDLFKAARGQILELIGNLPEAWEKHLILSHEGDQIEDREYRVEQMIGWQAQHALHHIGQIRETRRVHGL
jgi:uncharacterized damage-inducible protein DinB